MHVIKVEKAPVIDEARRLLGVAGISAEVETALNCAWDMGYRRAGNLAEMARQMLTPPRS